ncbi:putative Histone-fold protein [Trachipleistophora hominis]|uniref:Putative Histone-fold protein n=1 Tax=Trachipleistophora hominis TaxID=72359 RepID=L7K0C9_TRAHO|nr:putative Histone-fold protein [Trachipleistophora hominis]
MQFKETVITPRDKLQNLINDTTEQPFDREVINRMQQFSRKFINDVLTRSALLSEHKNIGAITSEEIFYVVEKEFDFCFGDREILNTQKTPAVEHIDKMAELSRHK